MLTFGQLKSVTRSRVFPSGESRNLRASHDKCMIDALVDIQRWAECFQSNNTHLVPHCATYYKCGITSFDIPRMQVHRLSVFDKINPETHREDATAADDYCAEIEYTQIDPCHMRSWFGHTRTCGTCYPLGLYFAIPRGLCGGKSVAPVPTDVGVAPGLPPLALGHHYPQVSTDAKQRARAGVWAIEAGRIMIAPWIQSTETIMLRWTGIKRDWQDSDLVDDDPELQRAVEEYLRAEHYRLWETNPTMAAAGLSAYADSLQKLIYDCHQETRVRACEAIKARGIAPATQLFFNDEQRATQVCPGNQTGDPVTVTIAKGTVASTVSISDANQRAVEQARAQALAQLVCTDVETVYYNTEQSFTKECTGGTGDPVTATVAAGLYSSTVSVADANAQALAAATAQANSDSDCVWSNVEQTYTASCATGQTGTPVTKTIAAASYTSSVSQADANAKALQAAKNQAIAALVCTGGSGGGSSFTNQGRTVTVSKTCLKFDVHGASRICVYAITVVVAQGYVYSTVSVADANAQADALANQRINQLAAQVSCGAIGNCPPPIFEQYSP